MAPPIERILVAQPVPIGGGSVIATPFQFLLLGEDTLEVAAWCSVADVAVFVQGRVLRLDNTIEPFQFTFPTLSNRIGTRNTINIGAGFILNLAVIGAGATLVPGQLFARLTIQRGQLGSRTFLGTLLQGYTTNTQTLAWPGSPIQLSTEGQGVIRQFTGTNPAPGVDIDEVVPTGARWELISIGSLLTTSAAVGNRTPILRLETAAGGILAQSIATVQTPPSNVHGYWWMQGIPTETNILALGSGQAGLPTNPVLLAGNHILTVTLGIAAGDDWQVPDIAVREWLEGNT